MYSATWINRWEHGCTVEYDLLLKDDEGILSDQRIPKSFCNGKKETQCSDIVLDEDIEEFLLQLESDKEILRILDGYTSGD